VKHLFEGAFFLFPLGMGSGFLGGERFNFHQADDGEPLASQIGECDFAVIGFHNVPDQFSGRIFGGVVEFFHDAPLLNLLSHMQYLIDGCNSLFHLHQAVVRQRFHSLFYGCFAQFVVVLFRRNQPADLVCHFEEFEDSAAPVETGLLVFLKKTLT